jgi:hypothetical protein
MATNRVDARGTIEIIRTIHLQVYKDPPNNNGTKEERGYDKNNMLEAPHHVNARRLYRTLTGYVQRTSVWADDSIQIRYRKDVDLSGAHQPPVHT